MSKPTITEFLEARIAEDEARAGSGWARLGDSRWETTNEGQDFLTPSAVLAECAAKRNILAGVSVHAQTWDGSRWVDLAHATERAIASVYSSHPDYDPEWVPSA